MTHREVPQIIKEVGFDFRWDNSKVWNLDLPVVKMNIDDLVWHFDIPFLHTEGEIYNLTPKQILENPDKYSEQYNRTMKADMKYPIDIMENNGRWLILDGLHRLMQAFVKNLKEVEVRIIPREKISEISK